MCSRCSGPHESAPTVTENLQLEGDSVIVGKTNFGEGEWVLFAARIACWWIFWPTVSAASLLLAPRSHLLFLSTSYTVAAGYRVARARCGEVDSLKKGEEEEKREGGLTGPRWPARTPVLLLSSSHLHRQNGFFPLSDSLFSSLSPSIYTHRIDSFPILFLFSPRLFSCRCSCFSE